MASPSSGAPAPTPVPAKALEAAPASAGGNMASPDVGGTFDRLG